MINDSKFTVYIHLCNSILMKIDLKAVKWHSSKRVLTAVWSFVVGTVFKLRLVTTHSFLFF
jgi:hypothetical protein